MNCEQWKKSEEEAKPEYTKVECIDKKLKGWDRRSIRRLNSIVTAVKKNTELSESKNMEMQLKSRYVEVSGRDTERDNDDSDYNDCDLDELNCYGGFTSVTEVNIAPDENTTNSLELYGATNITPV